MSNITDQEGFDMKKFLLCLFLVMSVLTGTASAADFSNLVILHTNDTHGYDQRSNENGINGMATVAGIRNELIAAGKQVLLLDAGDAIQDNNLVNFSKGASAIQFMNAAGYDAMCLGNHEFDYGQDVIMERIHEAHFPLVACNIIVEATGKPFTQKSVIIRKGKHNIGVIGITTPEASTSASPLAVAGLKFLRGKELYAAIQQEVDSLRLHHCDLIIALGHMGSENFNAGNRSNDVLENVNGIDIFIDGHDHAVKALRVNGTLLAETGNYTKNIGHIVYKDGEWHEELLPFDEAYPQDEKVAQLIDQTAISVNAELSKPIGTTPFTLDGSRDPGTRTMEMNSADFIADAFLWQASHAMVLDGGTVDAAIVNGGSIRSSIEAGTITLGDISRTVPYNNIIYVMTMKGRDLLELIEAATCAAPRAIGAFPQVAGMHYTLDTRIPYENGHPYPNSTYFAPKHPGARVTITDVGGKPFDLDKTYRIAAAEFIVRGGDTYGHAAEPGAITSVSTGYVDKDAIMNYLKEELHGTVPETYRRAQGRITIRK